MLPTTLLEYLITHNRFVSDVYIKDISDMKFQLHQFTFGTVFFLNVIKITNIYVSIDVYIQHSMLANT